MVRFCRSLSRHLSVHNILEFADVAKSQNLRLCPHGAWGHVSTLAHES